MWNDSNVYLNKSIRKIEWREYSGLNISFVFYWYNLWRIKNQLKFDQWNYFFKCSPKFH